jgi:hypothetical protein
MRRGADVYGWIKLLDAGKPCPATGRGVHYCKFVEQHHYKAGGEAAGGGEAADGGEADAKAARDSVMCTDHRPEFVAACQQTEEHPCIARELIAAEIFSPSLLAELFAYCPPEQASSLYSWTNEQLVEFMGTIFGCWEVREASACYIYNDKQGPHSEKIEKTKINRHFMKLVHQGKVAAKLRSQALASSFHSKQYFLPPTRMPTFAGEDPWEGAGDGDASIDPVWGKEVEHEAWEDLGGLEESAQEAKAPGSTDEDPWGLMGGEPLEEDGELELSNFPDMMPL